MTSTPTVAVFRPDDERIDEAVTALTEAGLDPVADPMLAIEPTGAIPRVEAADVVIFTSKTGVELVAEAGWSPPTDATIAAIGDATETALRDAGYEVDLVPEEYSSRGLVDALTSAIERGEVESIEVARSDHGSDVLLDGLAAAGATVQETVLYELRRPADAGESTELAAEGSLDGACFTSSLTVEHFLAAAADRGLEAAARGGLETAVVGAIGEPTAETLRERGIAVDVIPATADVDVLVDDVAAAIEARLD
ncbi:uroporphyrinogen-III synthase [Salinarchaeum sp. Harcht-Bsk1]|uniref:uroporphyrinogen-III synthase n=1 Tax=Salinarchaeum sp. Harcht-Bsk1 TaxID=1333523 RepID=UPI00034245D8|nr:uroporphyrinogen-III synthase [Salinarchaeum sp. Harcht-Bsk1]AGN00681.1 uroporphyrinogen-III synthase [Salinarchaeum sp. Harcht-Bsk1]